MNLVHTTTKTVHSKHSILVRGCEGHDDTFYSELFGNTPYVVTTTDNAFIRLLSSKRWSAVYFVPSICHFSEANLQIPGNNRLTKGWTLEDYQELINELQGREVDVVETPYEFESRRVLKRVA